jgi:hypothetical protein
MASKKLRKNEPARKAKGKYIGGRKRRKNHHGTALLYSTVTG